MTHPARRPCPTSNIGGPHKLVLKDGVKRCRYCKTTLEEMENAEWPSPNLNPASRRAQPDPLPLTT